MTTTTSASTVAFLLTDGYEDSELTSPWTAVQDAGAVARLIAPESGEVEGKNGHSQHVDVLSGNADASQYDALVLPGGVVNADHLRTDVPSVRLVADFASQGKPIAVICHGAWILIEADAVRDRRITSYRSLRTDLMNAGAHWVDEEVAIDGPLISSRTPEDLPAFNAALLEQISSAETAEPAVKPWRAAMAEDAPSRY